MLYKSCVKESSGGQSAHCRFDDSEASRCLVRKLIKESLTKLEEMPVAFERSIRWELGSCWLQHLQKQETPTDANSKHSEEDIETEHAVKGLGKEFKFLKKRDKKTCMNGTLEKEETKNGSCRLSVGTDEGQHSNGESSSENEWKKLISEEAFSRLKETGTGLHLKVLLKSLFLVHSLLVSFLAYGTSHDTQNISLSFGMTCNITFCNSQWMSLFKWHMDTMMKLLCQSW